MMIHPRRETSPTANPTPQPPFKKQTNTGARALLHALKDHAEVDTLCLGQNRIGSPGAHCIAEFLASSPPRLRSLSISDNPISDEGANDIVGALPACASLVTLSYVGCGRAGPVYVTDDVVGTSE